MGFFFVQKNYFQPPEPRSVVLKKPPRRLAVFEAIILLQLTNPSGALDIQGLGIV